MIFAFIAALIAVPVGVFLLRPAVGKLFHKDFQGVKTEAIVGPMVTLAVFLSAFVVAQATQTYQRSSQNVNAEGGAVALMYENAGLLPNGRGQAIQAATVCYARSAAELEWPAMDKGTTSPEVDYWSDQFNAEIPKVLDGPSAVVGQLVGLNRQQTENRNLRLYEAKPHLPVLTLTLMIIAVLGVILALSTLAVPDMRRRVLVTLMLLLATLLGGTLFLVEQLEEPFTGVIRVTPGVIQVAAKDMSADFATTYPGAVLPCDADGRREPGGNLAATPPQSSPPQSSPPQSSPPQSNPPQSNPAASVAATTVPSG